VKLLKSDSRAIFTAAARASEAAAYLRAFSSTETSALLPELADA
jgi:antirestriction protein ArdC